jgi:hypothetical protein
VGLIRRVFCTVGGGVWLGNREGILVRESVRGDRQVGDSEVIILRVFAEDRTGECR